MNKAPVKSITFNWKEGIEEDLPLTVNSWQAANKQLKQWAAVAPDNGCYDKTDFTVVWDAVDQAGEDYSYHGRFDLERRHAAQNHLLEEDIYTSLAFAARIYRPAWMTDAQWENLDSREGWMTDADWQQRRTWQDENKVQALAFLVTVDLGHFNNPVVSEEPAVNLLNEFMAFC